MDRSFLLGVPDKFGFGKDFLQRISILNLDATTKIVVNGWLTPAIHLERGVTHSPPLLYILAAEVLANHIRECGDIKGFLLPGAGGRLSPYANIRMTPPSQLKITIRCYMFSKESMISKKLQEPN